MATILSLDQSGNLFRLDVLDPGVQEFRQFYASPRLRAWISDDLPNLRSSLDIEQSPLMQFFDLAEVFCSGGRLDYGYSFKPLTHHADGVWQLKTQDLRIFGWFHRRDCFVGVVADDATRIKTHDLYHGYARVTTAGFRDAIDLDDPKYVPGDDPHAVVSNFDYS
jgi:hypothetical protein